MNPYDATSSDGSTVRCIVCDKPIRDGNWFARIRINGSRVLLCRPWCAERFAVAREGYAWKIGSKPAPTGKTTSATAGALIRPPTQEMPFLDGPVTRAAGWA